MSAARKMGAWDGKVRQVVVHGQEVDVIMKSVIVQGKGIESLSEIEGLEEIEGVVRFDLRNNRLRSLDLGGYDNLRGVEWLDLAYNRFAEIPHLDCLSKLSMLDLGCNQIRRIEHLDALEGLAELQLYENEIETIEGLDRLGQLRDLDLSTNRVSRLAGLDALTNLEFLDVKENPITRIEGLGKLDNLKLLGIYGIELPWDVLVIDLGGYVDDQGRVDGQLAVQYCREHGV